MIKPQGSLQFFSYCYIPNVLGRCFYKYSFSPKLLSFYTFQRFLYSNMDVCFWSCRNLIKCCLVNHHLKQSISFVEQVQPLSEIIFVLKVWSSLLLGLMWRTPGEAALGFLNQAASCCCCCCCLCASSSPTIRGWLYVNLWSTDFQIYISAKVLCL